jgi:hypothetical protein
MGTKARFLWFGLVVVIAIVAAFKWVTLGPADYEECIESAAKDARSKEALPILISSCNSKFRGRRKLGGGYAYYDSRQDRSFDIVGPNPTSKEMDYVNNQYSIYLEEQRQAAAEQAAFETRKQEIRAEQKRKLEARQLVASKAIEVSVLEFTCGFSVICEAFTITIRAKNQSTENISHLSLGWVFIPKQETSCPSSIPFKTIEQVSLRPGDTSVLHVDGIFGPKSRDYRICLKLTGVTIGEQ